MKKSIKITLLVAAALVLVGCAIAILALALGGSFRESTREVVHAVEGEFVSMDIHTDMANVRLEVSEDGTCYAVCDEIDRISYTVELRDGVLLLRETDDRQWYEYIGINVGGIPRVTLYLPKGAYDRLTIKTSSGDIVSEEVGLSFTHVSLATGSGSIRMSSPVREELTADSSSGNIALSDMTLTSLTATSSSGDISLADLTATTLHASTSSASLSLSYVRADEMELDTSSGKLTLYHVFAEKSLQAVTSSGAIRLDNCDAGKLYLQSASGSITGSLSTDKLFDVHTNSGRVICPPSVAGGGDCVVRTSSGDISLIILR